MRRTRLTLALAILVTVFAAGAGSLALAASPHEGTAWHLYVSRDETKIAGIGSWNWGSAEAMGFLLPGGACRFDVYSPGEAIESIAPPAECLANACVPCTWSGDAKGKRVTVRFSNAVAYDLIFSNLMDIAYDEDVDTGGMDFKLTKNKSAGVVKSGKLTFSWDIAGKLTVPSEGLKNRNATHQVMASGMKIAQ